MDLRQLALDGERAFPAAGSDVSERIGLTAIPWLLITYEDLRALPLDPHQLAEDVERLVFRHCRNVEEHFHGALAVDQRDHEARVRLGAIELRDPR